jgi:hypothetical protein
MLDTAAAGYLGSPRARCPGPSVLRPSCGPRWRLAASVARWWPIWVIIADLRARLGRRSRPASTQPTLVPPSKAFGMAESFFSALNSSVALLLFHSTESPTFVT